MFEQTTQFDSPASVRSMSVKDKSKPKEAPPFTLSGRLQEKKTKTCQFYFLSSCWLFSSNTNSFSTATQVLRFTRDTKLTIVGTEITIHQPDRSDLTLIVPRGELDRWRFELKTALENDSNLTMEQFRQIRVLGRGFFGKVLLVERIHPPGCTDPPEFYALKIMSKRRLYDLDQVQTAKTEHMALKFADSFAFIVQMKFSFQTPHKVYVGLEYAPGGVLLTYLQSLSFIPLEDTRLYIAELILAIEHLHSIGIIYRDLKPENVLIGRDGHIMLTDFGLAKICDEDELLGETVCGTPDYMAPEIVRQEVYSEKVDIWGLGVVFYEMLVGYPPFQGEAQPDLFANIIQTEPDFPQSVQPTAAALIRKMLNKNPEKRPGIAEIRADPFFAGLDWLRVLRKEIAPRSGFKSGDFSQPLPRDTSVSLDSAPAVNSEFELSNFSWCVPSEVATPP
jgi:serine/threonine protein kinase